MKLIINKFPPITQRCEIDLSKKLTLFVGHNNSGKTYISQLIWRIYHYTDSMDYIHNNRSDYQLIRIFPDNLKSDNFEINFNDKLLKNISKFYTNYLKYDNLNMLFKKDIKCDFQLKIEQEDILKLEIKNMLNAELYKISKIKNSTKIKVQLNKNTLKNINKEEGLFWMNYILVDKILNHIFKSSIFLPSSRLFLPSFYKYIFNTEKDFKDNMYNNLDNINETNKKFYAPSYTQPVDDLIKKLIFSLDKPLEHNIYLDKLSEIIEGNISVDRAEEIGMADISYNHKSGENIPMYLSSSMVNQLSTLYLYFKYWYDDNSFLIIDEPEMNLHPSKKIEVIELLMSFASENKLLIATHSNTIAKSLINYMHLFDLKEKHKDTKAFVKENELKMDTNIALSSNDIGIYYFNGKTIIPYKKDNDSDIHFGTFTEVEELQNKQFEYLIDELEDYE